MKKPTLREMRWINKGIEEHKSYNKITAKADDAILASTSNEDFIITCSVEKNQAKHGLIISHTEKTFCSISANEKIEVILSNNSFQSSFNLSGNEFLKENRYYNFQIKRNKDSFLFQVQMDQEYIDIANISLPGCLDAITFGLFFKNNINCSFFDFKYQRD